MKDDEFQFEWDNAKAARNLLRHNIDFNEAVYVFGDPFKLEVDVSRLEDGELRTKVIGTIKDDLIVAVICTDRSGKTRIISARKARHDERRQYNESKTIN